MNDTPSHRLALEDSALLLVDAQVGLMPRIHEHARTVAQCSKLIRAARILGVPIVWSEHYRKGFGSTVPELAQAIGDAAQPIEKMAFGCLDDDALRAAFESLHRSTLILCGIEAHVCVMNSALRALDEGRRVAVVCDAVSSRRASDRDLGLARMTQAGVVPVSVEMLIMEWMRVSGTSTFKKILPILKED